jgi:hypothetical protein
MEFDHKGKKYEVIFGSDIIRNGVFLELDDITETGKPIGILEVFFNDSDGSFIFNAWKEVELPFEIIEFFIKGARERLPPARNLKENEGQPSA